MATKSEYLQIRLTARQKADLKDRAKGAGQDMSSYVMSRALPSSGERFVDIVRTLSRASGSGDSSASYALAELNDLLTELAPVEFISAVREFPLQALTPFLRNYVAAMVEVAADRKDVPPPAWTSDVRGLEEPYFATPLPGLRLHLLRSAPIPFKRRNLFVDATVGARV